MKGHFAGRMGSVRKSFIREILKVAQDPAVISFAGGLPNPDFFPGEALRAAADTVLASDPAGVLQYAPTPGYLPLREYIAQRYARTSGIVVDPDEILITNGSQQGLDLVAKILIDPGDRVIVESPSYLGGIQAFSMYEPAFCAVPLERDGVNTALLAQAAAHASSKLLYALPNFQNPSGISYSAATRKAVAEVVREHDIYLIEDDPYRDLRFLGEHKPTISADCRENAFLLGSFSKVVAPALRMGWVATRAPLMEKLLVAKQAADLHSNYITQRVLHQYLMDNDVDAHIDVIREAYRRQREKMIQALAANLPQDVTFTLPEGGMFLWVTLPEGVSATALFEAASKRNVVFVPGMPFFVDGGGENCLRLNFSNTSEALIETGVARLGEAYREVNG